MKEKGYASPVYHYLYDHQGSTSLTDLTLRGLANKAKLLGKVCMCIATFRTATFRFLVISDRPPVA